jgi:hypothetical protein
VEQYQVKRILGATPTAALSLTLAFAILLRSNQIRNVVLTPTIAVEQNNSETAIRFALWHGVFSVEVSRSYKAVKAK